MYHQNSADDNDMSADKPLARFDGEAAATCSNTNELYQLFMKQVDSSFTKNEWRKAKNLRQAFQKKYHSRLAEYELDTSSCRLANQMLADFY